MVSEFFFPCIGSKVDDDVAADVIEVKTHDEYNPDFTGIPILEINDRAHPHALYCALEKRDWEEAADLLKPDEQSPVKEEEKDSEVKSPEVNEKEGGDAPSEDEPKAGDKKGMAKHEVLAKTWFYRKDRFDKMAWRLLPIHGAVTFGAPFDIIERILEVHPDGAKLRDDRGNLPLHLGYSEGCSIEKVELIKNAYPEAADMTNSSIEKVELIKNAYPEAADMTNNNGLVPGENLGSSAAVQKMKEEMSTMVTEAEDARINLVAMKEAEIAAITEKHESELLAQEEAKREEVDALNIALEDAGKEHEASLKKIMDEKDVEIESLKQELAKRETEIQEVKEREIQEVKEREIEGVKESEIEGVKESEIEGVKESEIEGVKESEIQGVEESEIQGVKGTEIQEVKEDEEVKENEEANEKEKLNEEEKRVPAEQNWAPAEQAPQQNMSHKKGIKSKSGKKGNKSKSFFKSMGFSSKSTKAKVTVVSE
eukprot:CAMPEP_0113572598 /NCGR_PEP_ID=MMETSP0015_2-20120614/26175_1 /TAXON_ID=2838 /ORGANISM="Odontella" /LENGTH=482 /DNA_ID=CAMNT_0000475631 /DNA_START=63 /DNA_END=1512 /DNA_ORIENTATION=+ /assembly_acc=CAM_ASM_000160